MVGLLEQARFRRSGQHSGPGIGVDLGPVGRIRSVHQHGKAGSSSFPDHSQGVLAVLRQAHLRQEIEVVLDDRHQLRPMPLERFREARERRLERGVKQCH
jgi:hypothetical protein